MRVAFFLKLRKILLIFSSIGCGLLLSASLVSAGGDSIPWQCTSYTYTGPSQEACIQSLSDPQEEKIASLERKIKRQQFELEKLKNRMRRQSSPVMRQTPYYPSNAYGPPPLLPPGGPWFGGGFPLGFGGGFPLGLGVGQFPFLPPIAIVID
ncbi:MAG: hypothetical protein MRJ96_13495 [Nitrospirales bacterium]|nr:hypothetical protein [Nitrospira sp.]MDR4502459.1 hypothetical protein [Nitrospirales bacterium]